MDYEMKSLNYKIRAYRFRMVMLLALFCCTTVFCYGQDKKPNKTDLFYSKIVMLKPGISKEEVKKIMGEPYKISFTTNDKQEFVEDLYYKILLRDDKWTILTYQCVFVNSKLASLLQKEVPYSTSEVTVSN